MQSQSTPVSTCPRCQEHSAASSLSLMCSLCSSNIHLECLSPKTVPALKGDTFFSLNCNQCSSSETDEVGSWNLICHITCKKWRLGDEESHLMAWCNPVEPLPPAHNQHLQQPWLLSLEEWYCFTHSNPLVKYIWPCSEEEENMAGASSLFLLLHLTTHFCSAGFCLWLSLWQFFHIVWVWSLHNWGTGMVAPQESRPPCNSTEQDAS